MLKTLIAERYLKEGSRDSLVINLCSFGYKFGIPLEADLVFDVRFLPNPYYEPELRGLRGNEKEVIKYLEKYPETKSFMKRFFQFIDYLIPAYIKEGKSCLTISIGCTGGKHRSVYVTEELKKHFSRQGMDISITHRDIGK
jgi:UPF0042 nucleotide-binding protein